MQRFRRSDRIKVDFLRLSQSRYTTGWNIERGIGGGVRMIYLSTWLSIFAFVFTVGCGRADKNTSDEAIVSTNESQQIVPERPDLSQLLKKGMAEKDVIESLDATASSAGPTLTVNEENVRYRTRKFPRRVVEVA